MDITHDSETETQEQGGLFEKGGTEECDAEMLQNRTTVFALERGTVRLS